jgi:hypothetical protein
LSDIQEREAESGGLDITQPGTKTSIALFEGGDRSRSTFSIKRNRPIGCLLMMLFKGGF